MRGRVNTEAAQAKVDLGFQRSGPGTIIGRAARGNAASIRGPEKVGMRFWKQDACEGIEDPVLYRVEHPWRKFRSAVKCFSSIKYRHSSGSYNQLEPNGASTNER